jgi:drug/metabolite transporter superfamily protein YnfA
MDSYHHIPNNFALFGCWFGRDWRWLAGLADYSRRQTSLVVSTTSQQAPRFQLCLTLSYLSLVAARAVLGSLVLVVYGFLPTLQPSDSFGRIYAVYGGFFIVLSFLFGWFVDGQRPDKGDVIGGAISLVGVLIILFWPR